MSEEKNNENVQQFHVQRVYLKDLSFETPMGAEAFITEGQPDIDQELGTETNRLDEDLYEVILRFTITAKLKDKTVFLIEVHYAGLFTLNGIDDKHMPHVLNTTCPQILFPYVREVIDSTLVKGSFPPLVLPPVNFEALFAQAVEERKAKTH